MDREEYNTKYRGGLNYSQLNIFNEMRMLWEQHIFWTRSFIISAVDNLEDLEYVTARLLRNPSDFAGILQYYYGREKAMRFKTLLEDHLKIAAEITNFAKQGDAKAVEQYSKLWYANADDIAEFFSEINPYWDESLWRDMLYDHLRMVENELNTRMNKDYKENVASFDMMEAQALNMADVMASGLIQQFRI
ncbi:MAG: glycosyltransferase [Anaerovoracaceae bacterium]|jgi:hypothetical protein